MTLPRFAARSYDFTEDVQARNWIGGAWQEPDSEGAAPRQEVPNPRCGRAMGSVQMSGGGRRRPPRSPRRAPPSRAGARRRSASARRCSTGPRAAAARPRRALLARLARERQDPLRRRKPRSSRRSSASSTAARCRTSPPATSSRSAAASPARWPTSRSAWSPASCPFNFPIMVPMWMIPQALVGGNAFLLKPSERVPLTTLRLAEIFAEAGLPAGIFSLVQGGQPVVEAICDHPGIEAIGFVGSTAVARAVYARAAAAGKRALCLGGAKNHLILVPGRRPRASRSRTSSPPSPAAPASAAWRPRCWSRWARSTRCIERDRRSAPPRCGSATTWARSPPPPPATRIARAIDEAEQPARACVVDGRGQRGTEGGYWVGPTILDRRPAGDGGRRARRSSARCSRSCASTRSSRRSPSRTPTPTATPRPSTPPRATSPGA